MKKSNQNNYEQCKNISEIEREWSKTKNYMNLHIYPIYFKGSLTHLRKYVGTLIDDLEFSQINKMRRN